MDLDLFIAIFFAIILILISIEYDDGFVLFMLGFLNIAVAMNMYELFGIIQTSYNGFGNLLQIVFVFAGVFCFVKMAMAARESGLFSSVKREHD